MEPKSDKNIGRKKTLRLRKKIEIIQHEDINAVRYGVGMDVHKETVVVCVSAQLLDTTIVQVKQHTFQNRPDGLQDLVMFLHKYRPIAHYLMECTGVYHLPVYHALRKGLPENSHKVIAMNPLLVNRRITDLGVKTDKADARDMANLSFYDALIKPSYIGDEKFFFLRGTMRSYFRSKSESTRFKNRLTTSLDSVNQKFTFNLSREWCLELLDTYISQDWSLKEAFSAYVQGLEDAGKGTKVVLRHEKDLRHFGDIHLSSALRFKMQIDLACLLNQEHASALLLRGAEKLVLDDGQFREHYQSLLRIPCVGPRTALTVLLELGDFHRFHSRNAFVKYCGVIPIVSQTGKHKSHGKLNRFSNAFLREALTQAAGKLINLKRLDCDLTAYAFKQRFQRNLSFKKASMKVAQKLARIAYLVLVEGVQYRRNFELDLIRQNKHQRRLERHNTLLESSQLRALKRDIQGFFITHSELLNSTSRYHLVTGFHRLIRKARWMITSEEGDGG